MADNCPEVMTDNISQIEEAQRTSNMINSKNLTQAYYVETTENQRQRKS